jgi:hypothetical protein
MEFHNFQSLLISMEMLSRLLLEYAISEVKKRGGGGKVQTYVASGKWEFHNFHV